MSNFLAELLSLTHNVKNKRWWRMRFSSFRHYCLLIVSSWLFIYFTLILKIIVILFCSVKISRIFVKEITTKTNQNGNYLQRNFKRYKKI